jgi:serine/threonine protein kinase
MSLILETKINSGSFGNIYQLSETEVAKVVNIPDGTNYNLLEPILYFTKCPYLINGIGYSLESNRYIITMPKANYTLTKALKYKLKFNPVAVMVQIALGVKYLHDHNIIHGDIKPSNILIFKSRKNIHVKLSDFGLSYFCFTGRIYTNDAYTCGFKPPEIFSSQSYSFSSDIWALGQTFKSFQKFNLPDLEYLIENMTRKNEKERWNIHQVLEFLLKSSVSETKNFNLTYEYLLHNLPIENVDEKIKIMDRLCRSFTKPRVITPETFENLINFFRDIFKDFG